MKKAEKKSETSNLLILIVIMIGFLSSFGVSYLFTHERLTRNSPVSVGEIAESYSQVLSTEDLNNLYIMSKEPDSVPILAYHQVREVEPTDTHDEKLFITTPEIFAQEMQYLHDNNFTVITLNQYLKFLQDKLHNPISKNSVVLTFDDGYASQFTYAYPILKKYNFVATFFLYTECLDKYPICLTAKEISEMVSGGMLLGNHTVDHPYLTDYKSKTIEKEITGAQKYLENHWPKATSKVLAYPYGLENETVVKVLQKLKYKGAVGVSFYAHDPQNIYNLPRYTLGNNFQNFLNIFKADSK